MFTQKIEETCLSAEMEKRFGQLWNLIGNTPMLELR